MDCPSQAICLMAISAVCRATSSAMRAISMRSCSRLEQSRSWWSGRNPDPGFLYPKIQLDFLHHHEPELHLDWRTRYISSGNYSEAPSASAFVSYRSSIVARATSSASLLMLSMKGVQRPVWVSASSCDILVTLSDVCDFDAAWLFSWQFAVCLGGGACDADVAFDWSSCFCCHSLSESTSSSTMSGFSLSETVGGQKKVWFVATYTIYLIGCLYYEANIEWAIIWFKLNLI